jgi:L-aminopeptidase/D-esterase-like protein
VGALAVVNALGDVLAPDGRIVAGSRAPRGTAAFTGAVPGEHTTLLLVATDARLSREECLLVAQRAHTGLARCVHPVHTRFDGDLAFALATGVISTHLDRLLLEVVLVVEDAVRAAVSGARRGAGRARPTSRRRR